MEARVGPSFFPSLLNLPFRDVGSTPDQADKGLTPDQSNRAAQRPGHGLDLQNGIPGSAAVGGHELVPPFSPLDGAGWSFNPAPRATFFNGYVPAPLPSPAHTVDPGSSTAREMLSEALVRIYPHFLPAKILEAIEAVVQIMEDTPWWTQG